MTVPASEITASVMSKGANLLVQWRGQFINFGSVRIRMVGTIKAIAYAVHGLITLLLTEYADVEGARPDSLEPSLEG